MNTIRLQGYVEDRAVFLNFRELLPGKSQKMRNHSPDGFMWGYHGSGPAQLALAVMLEFLPEEKAQGIYQKFKGEVIAALDKDKDFDIEIDITKWLI
jgi:hypothetical protein